MTELKKCAYTRCQSRGVFIPKGADHRFCSRACREAFAYGDRRAKKSVETPRRRRLWAGGLHPSDLGPFSSTKSVSCKPTSTPDLGAAVREQIQAAVDAGHDSPICLRMPDGEMVRVWLAYAEDPKGKLWPNGKRYSPIIGDDRHWRLNLMAKRGGI